MKHWNETNNRTNKDTTKDTTKATTKDTIKDTTKATTKATTTHHTNHMICRVDNGGPGRDRRFANRRMDNNKSCNVRMASIAPSMLLNNRRASATMSTVT